MQFSPARSVQVPTAVDIGSLSAIEGENGSLDIELTKLDRKARKYGIRRLTKNTSATSWKGPGSSKTDMDQVLASSNLVFHSFSGADIDVRGWPQLSTEIGQVEWIRKYSYHGLVYFELDRIEDI